MKKTTRQKIIYVITKSNGGGAQRYVYDMAATMSASYDVLVVLGGEGPLKDKLEAIGVQTISLPFLARDTDPAKDISVCVELYRIFKEHRPDIVHLNSSKIGGLGAIAAKLARVKVTIFTCHGWAFNENRPFYQKLIIGGIYWVTMQLCTKTILVSHALAHQIEWWPNLYGKTDIIWLGIDNKTLAPHKAALSKIESLIQRNSLAQTVEIPAIDTSTKTKLAKSKAKKPTPSAKKSYIHIGSVGELHPIKGHIYALEALKQIVKKYPVHYTIIGEGEYRYQLEKRIKELGLEEYVTLAGHVPNIAFELKAFDIFLVPSLSEALAYVVLEAGLAELPVIASAVGGIPEIITDMHSGILVQPKKPDEIAYGLELLIENKPLREKYGTELKHRVTRFFGYKAMVQKTENLYLKLIAEAKTIEKKAAIADQETHS